MVRSEEKGKHWDQLHEEGVYGKTLIGPLYESRVTRDEGDKGTVHLKQGILLHEGITGTRIDIRIRINNLAESQTSLNGIFL